MRKHILLLSLLALPTLLQAQWQRLTRVPEGIYPGEGITYGGGYVWTIAGDGGDNFYAYDVNQSSPGDVWLTLEPCVSCIDEIGDIEYETGFDRRIFVVDDDALYIYTKLYTTGYEGYWEDPIDLPEVEFGQGTCIAFQHVPNPHFPFTGYLYLLQGESGTVDNFYRRAIEVPEQQPKRSPQRQFDWEVLEPILHGVNTMGAMCYNKMGDEEGLYVFADAPDNAFYYYSIKSNTWEIIDYTREQHPGSDIVSATGIWGNTGLYCIFGEFLNPVLWLYNIPFRLWLSRGDLPNRLGNGASLAYRGELIHDLYLVVGRGASDFYVNREPDKEGIQSRKITRISQNAKVALQSNRIMVQYSTNTESKVIIQVHDLSGKYLKTLFQGNPGKGEHLIFWNKTDRYGTSISSGIYFISINIGNKTERLKVAISK